MYVFVSMESSCLGSVASRGGFETPLVMWIIVSLGTCRQWVVVRWLGTFILAGDGLCGWNDLPRLSRTFEGVSS